jgi:hypothetical protein
VGYSAWSCGVWAQSTRELLDMVMPAEERLPIPGSVHELLNDYFDCKFVNMVCPDTMSGNRTVVKLD